MTTPETTERANDIIGGSRVIMDYERTREAAICFFDNGTSKVTCYYDHGRRLGDVYSWDDREPLRAFLTGKPARVEMRVTTRGSGSTSTPTNGLLSRSCEPPQITSRRQVSGLRLPGGQLRRRRRRL